MKKKKSMMIVGIICLLFVIIGYFLQKKPSLDKIKESVVMIKTYDENENLISTGSGFCVFEDDYILTNYHVIKDAVYVEIVTNDEWEVSATEVLIYDWEGNDVALLKVNSYFKPLVRNEYPKLKTGQEIIAIGSPLGELNTVSTGIISNLNSENGIQITAPISHGSSGGVLLDESHRVIGVTYASIVEGQNINYAIPEGIIENMYKYYKSGKNEKHYKLKSRHKGIESIDDYLERIKNNEV